MPCVWFEEVNHTITTWTTTETGCGRRQCGLNKELSFLEHEALTDTLSTFAITLNVVTNLIIQVIVVVIERSDIAQHQINWTTLFTFQRSVPIDTTHLLTTVSRKGRNILVLVVPTSCTRPSTFFCNVQNWFSLASLGSKVQNPSFISARSIESGITIQSQETLNVIGRPIAIH